MIKYKSNSKIGDVEPLIIFAYNQFLQRRIFTDFGYDSDNICVHLKKPFSQIYIII